MIEFLILRLMCKHIGQIARDRGRSAVGYQFLLLAMWFGMEILGGVAGMMGTNSPANAYLLALAGAIGGAVGAFVIAKTRAPIAAAQRGFSVVQTPIVLDQQTP